jgi:hypothetical protein
MGQGELNWWERRSAVVVLTLFALLPLLWPTIPPLVDLPGHMGRYRVELDGDGSVLRHFYNFHWALTGNLGVDLLIVPMSRVFGLELGVKLIVMAIPAMTVAGMLWIAREVHGRIPPTALFALPLVYSLPLMYGFVNFALSIAFALLAFALWLRLARLGKFRLRALIFVLIAPLVWLTHIFGLGVLGLLAMSSEFVRYRDTGERASGASVKAMVACLVLAPALLVTLFFHDSGLSGGTGDWMNWPNKLEWLTGIFRDRWRVFDLFSLAVVVSVILFSMVSARLKFAKPLAAAALVMLAVYVLLPRVIFGSALADIRLAPFVLAVALLAIVPAERASPRFLNMIALAGLLFFGTRIVTNTYSLATISMRQDRALAALDHVPIGARLIAFTHQSWTYRMEHLAGMAIVRRRAFSNDQWNILGINLMSVIKSDAPGFSADPSQTVITNAETDEILLPLDEAIARFPRHSFDYLWLINPPPYDARLTAGMTPVWRDGPDALFRIDHK